MEKTKIFTAISDKNKFTISPAAHKIGELAFRSMLLELSTTPKPGLVDRFNNGSHKDMDFNLFVMSTSAIAPYMIYIALAGLEHKEEPEKLLPKLRIIGIEAEHAMFDRTGGVNTQKGLIFLMGITSAVAGYISGNRETLTSSLLSNLIKETCKDIVKNELEILHNKKPEKITAGEKIFLQYGLTGIRGEAEKGLPAITGSGLPALKKALEEGLTLNDAGLHALCHIMGNLDDTTILNRHNITVLKEVKGEMKEFSENGGPFK